MIAGTWFIKDSVLPVRFLTKITQIRTTFRKYIISLVHSQCTVRSVNSHFDFMYIIKQIVYCKTVKLGVNRTIGTAPEHEPEYNTTRALPDSPESSRQITIFYDLIFNSSFVNCNLHCTLHISS